MKRILLLIFFIATTASAQFGGHIKAGAVFSFAEVPDNYDRTENRVSYYIGGDYDWPLNESVTVSTGIAFFQTGIKYIDFIKKAKFSNLQLAPSVKIYSLKNLYLKPGGYISYILDSELEGFGGPVGNLVDIKKMDYGALLGIGYQIGDFTIEASYNHGFADLLSYNESGFIPGSDPAREGDLMFRNRFFVLGLSYRLR